jgi:hypothetical protein
MGNWYDKAMAEIEEDFEEGRISLQELNRAMRELDEEYDREYQLDDSY